MAEVYKSSVRRGGQKRGGRGKVPTTIRSDLKSDIDPSTYANPAGSKATKRVQTAYPYKKKPESFPGSPKSKVGKQKPKTVDQPIYKRNVKGPADIKKSQKLSTSKRKTPSPEYGKAFSKWLGGIGDDIGEYASDVASGASSVGKKVSSSDLWKKWKAQWDGSDDVPNQPPPQTRKRIERAINKVTGKDDKKKTPYRDTSPGKPMPPASDETPPVAAPKTLAKEPKVKKKDISQAEAERRIAARKAQIKRERAAEASKKKKAAATPSKDGRSAKQIKAEDMHEGMSYSPKEETADFKDFLSKHGGVKGFQFNLVGKNKTKEAGMKRAREAYTEEQRDRKRPGQSDHYQYGEGRRAVKKKGGAMRKSQGGTIRLKTGGAVIDTYDYN